MSRSGQAFFDLCDSQGWAEQDNGPCEGPQQEECEQEELANSEKEIGLN